MSTRVARKRGSGMIRNGSTLGLDGPAHPRDTSRRGEGARSVGARAGEREADGIGTGTALHMIAYASRRVVDGDAEEMRRRTDRLVAAARAHNERHAITGLLMVGRGCFAQVLEGPRDAVEHVYRRRVLPDPRHDDVVLLTTGVLSSRAFGDWSTVCVADESGLLDRFFASRVPGAAARAERSLVEPMPPCELLLTELEYLLGRVGHAVALGERLDGRRPPPGAPDRPGHG